MPPLSTCNPAYTGRYSRNLIKVQFSIVCIVERSSNPKYSLSSDIEMEDPVFKSGPQLLRTMSGIACKSVAFYQFGLILITKDIFQI